MSEYAAWREMKYRCNTPTAKAYPNYGGRGIKVCSRWEESFEYFLSDMGPKPDKGYSLDRINNNKGYSPSNCRWATQKTQNRNRRDNVAIGNFLAVSEASEALGIKDSTLRNRISKGDVDVLRAVRKKRDKIPLEVIQNLLNYYASSEEITKKEACLKFNIDPKQFATLRRRYEKEKA